ncbi:MAG: FAD-dependent oxidoreductase [Roseitalea porphyridii]|uniref:NAD(P)/FAD-dependent oxidoreductase n=1 Tax=Roseitalea porphyridii TaxID=1852022 RepID=UPI0032D8F1D5
MKIAIVGGGIAGLSSAWALIKAGHQVTLYEQGSIPNPLSASGDEHRIIRRAYGGLSGYARRIDEAYGAWDELWDDLGEKHLVENGFLIVSRQPGDEAEQYRDGLIAGGYPLDLLDSGEAAERFAFLEAGTFRYAGFSPEGGALLCQKIAGGLEGWLRNHGAAVHDNTPVTAVDPAGTVITAEGATDFDIVIVTAGAWVLGLVPGLAGRLATYRTAVAYFTPPPDLADAWVDAPVMLDAGADSDGYAIPPIGGSGLKLGTGNHKRQSPPDADRTPAPDEADAIRRWFSPPLARLDEYRHEKTVTCAYTFTADERFALHRRDRLWVVSACSGHGYKFGAAVGRRVARHVPGGEEDRLQAWLEARD